MFFIGIDLAWSDKNGSGIAVFQESAGKAVHIASKIVFSDDEIIEFIKETAGDHDAFVAIDAPLVVPNESGRRYAETSVGKLFGKYHASAHSANRERLRGYSGRIRGEELSGLLAKQGFEHNPFIEKFERSRKFFEVYPHPSMIVLFNLDRIIPYKRKKGRSYTSRWEAFRAYQNHLKRLEDAHPPLSIPEEIIGKEVTGLKGQGLKDYEDLLDAVFCACIALYLQAYPEKCKVLGTLESGYIVTPVFDWMKNEPGRSRA